MTIAMNVKKKTNKKQRLSAMRRKGSPCMLLVGMETIPGPGNHYGGSSQNKTKQATFIISLAGDLAIVFFGIYQKISRSDHRQTSMSLLFASLFMRDKLCN